MTSAGCPLPTFTGDCFRPWLAQLATGGARQGLRVGRSVLRTDCAVLLGLAAPLRNSLRALRALRSDKRDESVDERASRWAASPARLGAPQARRTGPPHALGDELLVCGELSAVRHFGNDSQQQALRPAHFVN